MSNSEIRTEVINEGLKFYAVIIGETVNYNGEASVRILGKFYSEESAIRRALEG